MPYLVPALIAATASAVAPAPGRLAYVIRPGLDGHYSRTRVTLSFTPAGAGCRLLLPTGWFGGDGVGKAVAGLRAGPAGVRLTDTARPGVKALTYPPGRAVAVEYDVVQAPPIAPPGDAAAGRKPYCYHFGEDLLAVPDWDPAAPRSLAVEWADVPGGWAVCDSYGAGPDRREFRDTLARFRHATFVGGDFRLHRFRAGGRTITLAVRGRPAFRDADLVAVLRALYEAEGRFWGDDDFLYTLVVLYPTHGPAGNLGGEGRTNSFSVHLSDREGLGFGVKHLVAHELFHGWNPGKLHWDGVRSYWFTEGATDYYAGLMVLRAGLCPLDEYVASRNAALRGYYLSPARDLPYPRLMADRDASPDADRQIYARGMLLAADWDAEIRAATGGARSLDDVMRGLARAAAGTPPAALSDAAVAAGLRPYLGGRGAADIRRFIGAGETIRPRADGLGRWAALKTVPVPTFDLGFGPGTFARKVVTGVVPGGPAARAGLRDGQVVVAGGFVPGAADQPVELRVRDGAGERTIRYLPAGPAVGVPQYELRPGLSAGERAACLKALGAPADKAR